MNRKPRQLVESRYFENGSFYITKSESLLSSCNHLSGKIGFYVMDAYKQFQVDNPEDIPLITAIMNHFILQNH
jgi:CMP-N-acetylneuraminic acid synthetase